MKIAVCLLLAVLALRAAAGVLATDLQADALSAAQQRVLDVTLAEYAQPRREAALDVGRIKAIVADMQWASPPPDGVLKRLWRWFKRQLQAQEVEVDWLEKWLRDLMMMPQSVAEWVSRIAIGAMMVAVLVLVVNEVRRGDRRRSRRPRHASARLVAVEMPPDEGALTWRAVADLPLQDRPGATLRLVLAALTAQGRSTSRDGHTHRQIAAEAVRSDGAGEPLAQLAKMAERARFGAWRLDAAEGEQVLTLGRSIVDASASRS